MKRTVFLSAGVFVGIAVVVLAGSALTVREYQTILKNQQMDNLLRVSRNSVIDETRESQGFTVEVYSMDYDRESKDGHVVFEVYREDGDNSLIADLKTDAEDSVLMEKGKLITTEPADVYERRHHIYLYYTFSMEGVTAETGFTIGNLDLLKSAMHFTFHATK